MEGGVYFDQGFTDIKVWVKAFNLIAANKRADIHGKKEDSTENWKVV